MDAPKDSATQGGSDVDALAFRIVTRTSSNSSAILIPAGAPQITEGAAAPYPSEKSIAGFNRGRILDANLTLKNYSHTGADDVAVLLEGPTGRDAIVMSDVGSLFLLNNVTLVLDDEAPRSLPDNDQITGGAFKPTQGTSVTGQNPRPSVFPAPARFPPYGSTLSVFDGTNPNGTWRLFVFDDTAADVGRFTGGWSITIKARVLAPPR